MLCSSSFQKTACSQRPRVLCGFFLSPSGFSTQILSPEAPGGHSQCLPHHPADSAGQSSLHLGLQRPPACRSPPISYSQPHPPVYTRAERRGHTNTQGDWSVERWGRLSPAPGAPRLPPLISREAGSQVFKWKIKTG